MTAIVSGCLAKVRYTSKVFAEAQAKMLSEKYGRALRVYACGWCLGFHTIAAQKALVSK